MVFTNLITVRISFADSSVEFCFMVSIPRRSFVIFVGNKIGTTTTTTTTTAAATSIGSKFTIIFHFRCRASLSSAWLQLWHLCHFLLWRQELNSQIMERKETNDNKPQRAGNSLFPEWKSTRRNGANFEFERHGFDWFSVLEGFDSAKRHSPVWTRSIFRTNL